MPTNCSNIEAGTNFFKFRTAPSPDKLPSPVGHAAVGYNVVEYNAVGCNVVGDNIVGCNVVGDNIVGCNVVRCNVVGDNM